MSSGEHESSGGNESGAAARLSRRAALWSGAGLAAASAAVLPGTTAHAAEGAPPGGWIDVTAAPYGAKGDNATDDGPALQAAFDACPEGGVVHLPPGVYKTKQTLHLRRRNITIRGTHAGRWPYATQAPTCIKPYYGSFTGNELIRVMDMEEGAHSTHIDGVRLLDLAFNGVYAPTSSPGTVSGLYATGAVRDLRIERCSFWQFTGHGIRTMPYTRAGGAFVFPKGWRLVEVTTNSCHQTGFHLQNLTDASLTDCLAVGNQGSGFFNRSPGDVILTGCRAAWNEGHGYHLDFGNDGISYIGCTTDRNGGHGWYLTARTAANRPVLLSGCTARRDGRTAAGAGGLVVQGDATASHPPVIASGLVIATGVDDTGGGTKSPAYAVKVTKALGVALTGGYLEGATAPISVDVPATLKTDTSVLQYTAT
ncbi:glycosyl hydrolase family 28-related protein [Streptomyces tirandamycinicus]|uniref:right-handed parallel beta-helix repeat-containing protein n=1 Tax=Streptomyces tirandamycinicus TaxID=2174846 RepID=UPI00341AAAED